MSACKHDWMNLCLGAWVGRVYWRVDICIHCHVKRQVIP